MDEDDGDLTAARVIGGVFALLASFMVLFILIYFLG